MRAAEHQRWHSDGRGSSWATVAMPHISTLLCAMLWFDAAPAVVRHG